MTTESGQPKFPWKGDGFPWPDEDLPDLIQKVLRGERAIIVLDDSSGASHAELDPDRRLWAGILLHEETASLMLHAHMLYEPYLFARSGARTFHFTDLWTGNGSFSGWPVEERLWWIEHLGGILAASKSPVAVVQFTPRMIDTLHAGGFPKKKLPWFDTTEPDGAALLFTIGFMRQHSLGRPGIQITAVADRRKGPESKFAAVLGPDGTSPFDFLTPPGLGHASVDQFVLLQFADLVAWGYSRLELIEVRGVTNEYEERLRELLVQISRNWQTFGFDDEGEPWYKRLAQLESHPVPGRAS